MAVERGVLSQRIAKIRGSVFTAEKTEITELSLFSLRLNLSFFRCLPINTKANPLRKFTWLDHFAINSYWLGIDLATGIITPLLLPYLVVLFMPAEQKNTYLANLRVVGLAVAMLVQPLAGMLSDRSTSPLGRRRPYIIASALLTMSFLVVIGASPAFLQGNLNTFFQQNFGITAAYAVLLFGIVLYQFSSNLGQGALQGLIPDLVPPDQRGRSSGVKAVFELLPSVLIIALGIGKLLDQNRIGLIVGIMMAGFAITLVTTLLGAREQPLRERPTGKIAPMALRLLALTIIFVSVTRAAVWLVGAAGRSMGDTTALTSQIALMGLAGLIAMAGSIFIGVYLGARVGIGAEVGSRKSFIWWVINRLLFLAAVGSVQGFAQYFLRDVIQVENPGQATTMLLAVVAVFLIPSALVGGSLADRIGHRRLVGLSGIVAALGTLLLILAVNMPLVIVAGSIIGLATGTFFATNWALGTQLVPPQDAGRYLGISNLAGAGAGIVGAGIGGPLADFFNGLQPGLGYLVLFAIYAGLFLISALTLVKVKPGLSGF